MHRNFQPVVRAARTVLAAALVAAAAPGVAAAQQDATTRPTVDVSGVLFASYTYDVGPLAELTGNQFSLDRAYVTVRGTAGERASVRITSDLFRNAAEGYDLRVKYGYLQYDVRTGGRAFVRAGLLQTVMIEHEEQFWPRWISSVAEDRYRFFSSADVGISAGAQLPDRLGEVYATVTNGRSFQNVGNDDRFKDFALRLTLTPFAANAGAGVLRTLAISPWYYKGDTVSAFGPQRSLADAPDDYLGVVRSGRQRDRYGIFAGVRDPRLTVGAGVAQFRREIETGQNTDTSPIQLVEQTGRTVTGFVLAQPLQLADSASTIPLGVVFRYDHFTPITEQDGSLHLVIAGLTYDVSSRLSLALTYEETLPDDVLAPTLFTPAQLYAARLVARF